MYLLVVHNQALVSNTILVGRREPASQCLGLQNVNVMQATMDTNASISALLILAKMAEHAYVTLAMQEDSHVSVHITSLEDIAKQLVWRSVRTDTLVNQCKVCVGHAHAKWRKIMTLFAIKTEIRRKILSPENVSARMNFTTVVELVFHAVVSKKDHRVPSVIN